MNKPNQKGYVGYSMSKRAQEAYYEEKMPKSKWTKAIILAMMDERGYAPEIIAKAKAMKTQELKEEILDYAEWHHTSKYMNRTEFLELACEKSCAIMIMPDDEYDALRARKAKEEIAALMPKVEKSRKEGIEVRFAEQYDHGREYVEVYKQNRPFYTAIGKLEWATAAEVESSLKGE